jgi:hypothetical protein
MATKLLRKSQYRKSLHRADVPRGWRYRPNHGQSGRNRLVGRIGPEKRAGMIPHSPICIIFSKFSY